MSIVTVTLNPALDKTIEVADFSLGRLNSVLDSHLDPGGKGINVSKVVRALKGDTLALGFLGGTTGRWLGNTLDTMGIAHQMVYIEGDTRTNMKLFCQRTGQVTEVNEKGPVVHERDISHLLETVTRNLTPTDILVLSGSIPQGVPKDIYGQLIRIANERGCYTILDAAGQSFEVGVMAIPTVIKPNRHELESHLGISLDDQSPSQVKAHVVKAIDGWLAQGIAHVFISLGNLGGYYGSKAGIYAWEALPVVAHSSVGAGDAFVAALAVGLSQSLDTEALLRLAVATSAGAVTTTGTKPPEYEWILDNLNKVTLSLVR